MILKLSRAQLHKLDASYQRMREKKKKKKKKFIQFKNSILPLHIIRIDNMLLLTIDIQYEQAERIKKIYGGIDCDCTSPRNLLPWLSSQSGRLLTDRSPVQARVGANNKIFFDCIWASGLVV